MDFQRYDNAESFSADVLHILLNNEVENNLTISLLTESKAKYATDWLMATVADKGEPVLIAICTKPFNILLHEAENATPESVSLLARELKRIGAELPGVMAERGLALRFARAYTADGASCACSDAGAAKPHMSIIVMRLDELSAYDKAPGSCRLLEERDMFFAPYWERAFSEDCRVQVFSIQENANRIRTRVAKGTHFIWEDGVPVSQAVHGRSTPNGAVINMVYTPPHFRGRGYATSVVAELSDSLLKNGKDFCCLFADAGNPVSCELYRKLGYYDAFFLDDIRFDTGR